MKPSRTEFDPLVVSAEIKWLVAKIYFRFSHLFLHHPSLRDLWWEMAMEKEQHACILTVMSTVVKNDSATDVPGQSGEKTDQLKEALTSYLRRGTPTITPEEAFRIALEIEASEIDVTCSELLKLGVLAITEVEGTGVCRRGGYYVT